MLEAGLELAAFSPDEQTYEDMTPSTTTSGTSVPFSIPGASTDNEVPYEEWKNAYFAHQPQDVHVSTTSGEKAEDDDDVCAEGGVLEAWAKNENTVPEPGTGHMQQQELVKLSPRASHKETEQSKKEAIKREW